MGNSKKPRVTGPVFDDMGNRVALPGRVEERNVGCYSCIHFETGEIPYRERVQKCYQRDVVVHTGGGMPLDKARQKAGLVRGQLLKARGHVGYCRPGHNTHGADFVPAKNLCTHWTGVSGSSMARDYGEALSPLVEELYDDRGEAPVVDVPAAEVPDDETPPDPAAA